MISQETYQNKFCVVIISHGRAGRVKTLPMLRKQKYSGQVVIIIDNEDEQGDEYIEQYDEMDGVRVEVFNKISIVEQTDVGDNFEGEYKSGIFARNAAWSIVRNLGYQYFLVLDDDYTLIQYYLPKEGWHREVADLDKLFRNFLEFLVESGAIAVGMAQGGDYSGGKGNQHYEAPKMARKVMNSWFCDVEREFWFHGRLNGDVNTYVREGMQGQLLASCLMTGVQHKATQINPGGITETYLEYGTYAKSFYTVMRAPSCSMVGILNSSNPRIHHQIQWRYAVPKIVNENQKK